jgi:hypothetical protein
MAMRSCWRTTTVTVRHANGAGRTGTGLANRHRKRAEVKNPHPLGDERGIAGSARPGGRCENKINTGSLEAGQREHCAHRVANPAPT